MQHSVTQIRSNEPGKLRLQGFNNLTKTLSFNIYDVCYAYSELDLHLYLKYIDQCYSARQLTRLLREIADIIGANILNVAYTDYEPHGASVAILVSEGNDAVVPGIPGASVSGRDVELRPGAAVAHLDKSHLTVHTYPESHPSLGLNTFRVDIDVSTCGCISPLKAFNHLIDHFESDVVYVDYRVRGFTRSADGGKCFIDHEIESIQGYLSRENHDRYRMADLNLPGDNIFHTKMMLRELRLDDYLFSINALNLPPAERTAIEQDLRREMSEIFDNGKG